MGGGGLGGSGRDKKTKEFLLFGKKLFQVDASGVQRDQIGRNCATWANFFLALGAIFFNRPKFTK
jgi:hypothetical protein